MGQKPERTHAVVEGDDHHARSGESLAVIDWYIAGAARESAAVDVHKNGKVGGRGWTRGPDIQKQAVLARGRDIHVLFRPRPERRIGALHTRCAGVVCVENTAPGSGRSGFAPAKRANWWRSKANALKARNRTVSV